MAQAYHRRLRIGFAQVSAQGRRVEHPRRSAPRQPARRRGRCRREGRRRIRQKLSEECPRAGRQAAAEPPRDPRQGRRYHHPGAQRLRRPVRTNHAGCRRPGDRCQGAFASGHKPDGRSGRRQRDAEWAGPRHRREGTRCRLAGTGDGYDKSFQKSAAEQADKLPQSRPEVLAKVDEITLQVHTGFATQFAQIVEGATALETGAKAHSRQAATHMRAALDANATQSRQALDTGEKEQGAALQAQADAAQGMLDQSVAGALSHFGDGVSQAAQQLAQGCAALSLRPPRSRPPKAASCPLRSPSPIRRRPSPR